MPALRRFVGRRRAGAMGRQDRQFAIGLPYLMEFRQRGAIGAGVAEERRGQARRRDASFDRLARPDGVAGEQHGAVALRVKGQAPMAWAMAGELDSDQATVAQEVTTFLERGKGTRYRYPRHVLEEMGALVAFGGHERREQALRHPAQSPRAAKPCEPGRRAEER